MLDFDLAALYEVETKVFNQSVKRNIKRFPKDFMFQLTQEEWNDLRLQFVTSSIQVIDNQKINRSQFVTGSQKHRGTPPYAFTEQGVAMLSGILNSDRAIQMNIAINYAGIYRSKAHIDTTKRFKRTTERIKERVGGHDVQLTQIYDALENLLDEKAAQRKWDERERIGFKKSE